MNLIDLDNIKTLDDLSTDEKILLLQYRRLTDEQKEEFKQYIKDKNEVGINKPIS